MADDRMKDDMQRNMGTGGRDDQDFGKGQQQQTPGRNPQEGQQGQPGQQGGQRKDPLNKEDDEEFGGGGQRGGGQGRGGQNR